MGIFPEGRGDEREAGEEGLEESSLRIELIVIDIDSRGRGADRQSTWPRLGVAGIHDGVVQSGVLLSMTRWTIGERKTLYINCQTRHLTVSE